VTDAGENPLTVVFASTVFLPELIVPVPAGNSCLEGFLPAHFCEQKFIY
jgi:hypothetical protein